MLVRQYANQRQVTVHKVGSKRTYTKVSTNALRTAIKELRPSTFMLYMYFSLNADGFEVVLSPSHIAREFGMSRMTYYRALEELEEKHYLVPKGDSKTAFTFYEDAGKMGQTSHKNGREESQNVRESVQNWRENTLHTIKKQKTSPAGQPEGFPAQVGEQAAAAEVESFFLDL